jgi:FkbM family methyltransferase
LGRFARKALGLVGLEAVRLPGAERRLLFMGRRTRHQVGPDLVLHDHLQGLFERYAVDCVLDVGANYGQYGRELRGAGYRGRLLSFESVPQICERLRETAAGDPGWSVHAVALGSTSGTAELNVTRHDVFTSFRQPLPFAGRRFGEATAVARRERVALRRLEEVLDELLGGGPPPRCFLKMDTQGYDLRVFAGAGDRIKDVLGLQSEISCVPLYDGMPRMPEAVETYESAGFETTGIFPVSRDGEYLRVIELDIVMIRVDALSRPALP